MHKEVRLSDIARACGVSVSTVGKVLNPSGGANTRVSQATSERIMAVAREMHYCPNYSARNLRLGSGKLIGVLVDSSAVGGLARLLSSIESEAAKLGYSVMFSEAHDSLTGIIDAYRRFRQYGAKGVICISHDYQDIGEEVYRFMSNKPELVFVGKPKLEGATYVDACFEEKALRAVTYLWGQGRRRIGLLVDRARYLVLDGWRNGFRRAIEEMGGVMEVNGRIFEVIQDSMDPSEIHHAVLQGIEQGLLTWSCDGIIAMSDEYAGNLMAEISDRGLRIPEDIAVIGHGNDRFDEMLRPKLATIDDDLEGQGKAAVELLMRLLNAPAGGLQANERMIQVHPTFVLRDSAR